MQHFFVEPECVQDREAVIKDEAIAHQIMRVLRMQAGDKFILLDNSGNEFLCELSEATGKIIKAFVLETRKNTCEPAIFVTLYQALPKKMEKIELVLQKGTEIGASKFVPMITERTERSEISKRQRLTKILREAAEQCERGKIPELAETINFENAVSETAKQSRAENVLLHSDAKSLALTAHIEEIKKAGFCNIFIGPEGGFSEKEITLARKKGFLIASLGPRTLRTETAGIVALSLIVI